jgi:hypothetical protein
VVYQPVAPTGGGTVFSVTVLEVVVRNVDVRQKVLAPIVVW